MTGYLSIILHAHLPFVRHPEHEKFLEESWLFEAITETYLPLIQVFENWQRDQIPARITLSLSPTLCSMLLDELLRHRYARHLDGLIELAEKEIHRTHWDRAYRDLAWMYHHRLSLARETWRYYDGNLITAFKKFQDAGRLEIITTAATHGLLPLMANHPPSLRAQILTARDHYRSCFGRDPRGIWLPECAYLGGVEQYLQEANIRWFTLDTHGVLHAQPRPRYGTLAPIFTPNGVAAFGRDFDSSRQVWSKHEGYPGDPRYRDFYRDIGFDLDFEYVRPHLPSPDNRGFTGIKYFRITGASGPKEIYRRDEALAAASGHARHFLDERLAQIRAAAPLLDRPPIIVAPYDAELFGHWWYEGPEFLDFLARQIHHEQKELALITPGEYLSAHPTNQIASPGASSWGEEGYWRVWLNESNQWIYPHLQIAQERMSQLAQQYSGTAVVAQASRLSSPAKKKKSKLEKSPAPAPVPATASAPDALQQRALQQAARELLLAQASDWPFILRAGTSADYARRRVKDHLLRFIALHEQLTLTRVDEPWLREIESRDNLFPDVNWNYWK